MRYTHTIWLVVWNMFYCSIILRIILPTDELIFFRGVGLNHQPAIIYTYIYIYISPTECESNDNSCWDVINVDGDVTPAFLFHFQPARTTAKMCSTHNYSLVI